MIIAFDLEITTPIPEGDDWQDLRPLGISCAATHTSQGETIVWHDNFSPRMSKREVDEIAKYLYWEWREGAQIVTWNGLGFDFDVMHEECRWWKSSLRFMAWNHIDPGFQMLCEKGFMVGLDTAAKGMGLHGKTEGMSGKDAPVMWAEGRNQQEKVLEYVAQDAVTTLEVYEAILRRGSLSWISRSGRANKWRPEFKNGRMLTAKECMHIPEPDTSWMSDPWPRKKFYGWLDPLK